MNVFIERYKEFCISRSIVIDSVVTAFEITYDSDFDFKGETHNFWEFVCVLDGEIQVTAEDTVSELHKNQIIFHKPMEFHRICSANGTKPHVIIMSFHTTQPLPLKGAVYTLSETDIKELSEIIRIAYDAFDFQDICIAAQKEAKIIQAQMFINRLELFLLSVAEKGSAVNTLSNSRSAKNYAKIIETLKDNLNRTLTISDIAMLTNMSKSNVKKVFEIYTGEGVIKYFNRLKITEAIRMLEEGMTVGEISNALGFLEQNYFSTVFKRFTGYSPTKYYGRWEKLQHRM